MTVQFPLYFVWFLTATETSIYPVKADETRQQGTDTWDGPTEGIPREHTKIRQKSREMHLAGNTENQHLLMMTD